MKAGLQVSTMVCLIAGALVLCAAAHGQSATAPAPQDRTPAEWQALARADLDKVHELVLSAHPGWIDDQNPGFRTWAEDGYRQALVLVPQVVDYDSMESAVSFYIAGFRDGHFVFDSRGRGKAPATIAGWRSRPAGDKVVVGATAASWPVALPPVGARLVQCDGRDPDTIVKEDQAPFADLRDLRNVHEALSQYIAMRSFPGRELKRCEFETADGRRLLLDQHYGQVSWEESQRMRAASQAQSQASHVNRYWVRDDVLWIEAGNFWFQPGGHDAQDLDAMLTALRGLKGIRQIVFDTRGNQGGDSGIGQRIFDAATGGLEFDRASAAGLARTYALWRVSDTAIATWTARRDDAVRVYGADSGVVRSRAAFLERLTLAKAAGQPWVRQEGSLRMTRDDMRKLHARLRGFTGRVALLTDSDCVSACLDFADLVRGVPGSIHLGKTTSADTVYIDVGFPELPSGDALMFPLKVWRNRVRGNNEPLVPDVPLDVDMRDDKAVVAAMLAALKAPGG
jgi:hypothetical protein